MTSRDNAPVATVASWPPPWLKIFRPEELEPIPAIFDVPDPDSIDIPTDWRWRVACWPSAAWKAWRALADDIAGKNPTAEEIRLGQHLAYTKLRQAAFAQT